MSDIRLIPSAEAWPTDIIARIQTKQQQFGGPPRAKASKSSSVRFKVYARQFLAKLAQACYCFSEISANPTRASHGEARLRFVRRRDARAAKGEM
jgi:hypothetical protein